MGLPDLFDEKNIFNRAWVYNPGPQGLQLCWFSSSPGLDHCWLPGSGLFHLVIGWTHLFQLVCNEWSRDNWKTSRAASPVDMVGHPCNKVSNSCIFGISTKSVSALCCLTCETLQMKVQDEGRVWGRQKPCYSGNGCGDLCSRRAVCGILLHNANLLPQHSLHSIQPTPTPPSLCTSLSVCLSRHHCLLHTFMLFLLEYFCIIPSEKYSGVEL